MLSLPSLLLSLSLCAALALTVYGTCPQYAPVVTGISGCPRSDVWGTYDCAPGMTLTLVGANFSVMDQWSQVSIRAGQSLLACTDFQRVDNFTLTSTLPELSDKAQLNPYQVLVIFDTCQWPLDPLTVSYATSSHSSSPSPSSSASSPPTLSSSTGAASQLILPIPVVSRLTGCGSAGDLSSCDGASGASFITVWGANFTAGSALTAADSLTVTIQCQSGGTYTATPNPQTVSDSSIVITTPLVDKSDTNSTCALSVTRANANYINSPATSSTSASLQFSSYAFDVAADFELLGMGLRSFITMLAVVLVLLIVGLALCVLSCCCGVSLACLSCCRGRQETAGVIYSPQVDGYAAMA